VWEPARDNFARLLGRGDPTHASLLSDFFAEEHPSDGNYLVRAVAKGGVISSTSAAAPPR